jgi:hypothetical protein
MRKFILGLLSCSIFWLSSCISIHKTQEALPQYLDFTQLKNEYSIEDAIKDSCVVFNDLTLLSGDNVWLEFLDITQKGKSAKVRIANYYTDGESSSNYLTDLSYDGLFHINEMEGSVKDYKYLKHYSTKAGSDANYTEIDCYILVNEEDVSFENLERSLVSSNIGDYIDQYRIYVNLQ